MAFQPLAEILEVDRDRSVLSERIPSSDGLNALNMSSQSWQVSISHELVRPILRMGLPAFVRCFCFNIVSRSIFRHLLQSLLPWNRVRTFAWAEIGSLFGDEQIAG